MDPTETREPAEIAKEAEQVVKNYAFLSIWPGFFPVPWLDAALLLALQLKMLQKLAKVYGTTFSAEAGRSAIAALVGAGGSVHFALIAGQLLKTVPGIGQVAGPLTMTAFGGASTYAVGQIFIQHFESGGTLLTFDPDKVRDRYRQLCEEGALMTRDDAPRRP